MTGHSALTPAILAEHYAPPQPVLPAREVELSRYHLAMRNLALSAQQLALDAGNIPLREACAALVKLSDLSNQTGAQVNGDNVGNLNIKLQFLAHLVTYGSAVRFYDANLLYILCMERLEAGATAKTLALAIDPNVTQERLNALVET